MLGKELQRSSTFRGKTLKLELNPIGSKGGEAILSGAMDNYYLQNVSLLYCDLDEKFGPVLENFLGDPKRKILYVLNE